MKKLPALKVTEVLDGKLDPKWNYAKMYNIHTRKTFLEPCCLKSKPCFECA